MLICVKLLVFWKADEMIPNFVLEEIFASLILHFLNQEFYFIFY